MAMMRKKLQNPMDEAMQIAKEEMRMSMEELQRNKILAHQVQLMMQQLERSKRMMQGPWQPPPSFGSLTAVITPPTTAKVTPETVQEYLAIEPHTVTRRVPDSITMITGWRAWRTVMDAQSGEPRLRAVGQGDLWPAREKLVAKCVTSVIPSSHPSPKWECNCGVWAFKTIESLPEALQGQVNQESVSVIGSVHLWGRVIETEKGFRAQYAYPKELWLLEDGLEVLGWAYGVPVRSRKKF